MDTVDILVSIPLESAVGHHGVLVCPVSVIHRDDHRVVVLDRFAEFKCRQVVDVELNRTRIDLLVDTRLHGHIEDVIITIGRVKHFWCVVRVLLLRHTHVDADVGIAKRVIFERDVQFLIIGHSLSAKKYIRTSDVVLIKQLVLRINSWLKETLTAVMLSLLSATLM